MPIKYLTHTELERFFAGIDAPRDRAVFGVIYHYGLRVSEATLIRLHDVDFTRQTIYVRRVKGGASGLKPLLPNTAKVLNAYLPMRPPTGDALFTGRQGNLKRHRIQQLFKRYAHQANLFSFTVHSLRH